MRRDPDNPRERSKLPRGLRPELILYVEDDDDNWEVAELRLGRRYELVRAANDAEACALIRARRAEIDLVLMDIELRGSTLNGIELVELLRGNKLSRHDTLPDYARNLPTLSKPVIFVTAHGARFNPATLMLSGADKVITKPVDFAELQRALSELLLGRTLG